MSTSHDLYQHRVARLAQALGEPSTSAPRLVRDLVACLPDVAKDHADAKVDATKLGEFADWLYATHANKLNSLSPVPFTSAAEVLSMLSQPLEDL